MFFKLESIRGLAACLVVLFHSSFNFYGYPIKFVENSYLFVDLFFILSGFVMSSAYTSRIDKGLTFRAYIILRLGRIYPLHICILFIWVPFVFIKQLLFQQGFGGTDQLLENNLNTFLSSVFLIQSMGLHEYLGWNKPSWSISTELFAYIVFFVLSVGLDKKKTLLLPILISSLSYTLIISLKRSSFDITYDFGFFRCLGAFYLGVFIYRTINWSLLRKLVEKFINVLEVLSIILIVITVQYLSNQAAAFFFTLFSFTLSIYVFASKESGVIGKLLMMESVRKIGLWSYSIYLTHYLVLSIYTDLTEHIFKLKVHSAFGYQSIVINAVALITIIVISKFTYDLIEVPFRNKSRELAQNTTALQG